MQYNAPLPRSTALIRLLLSCFALTSVVMAQTSSKPNARTVHDSAIVVDTHADTPQRFLDENFDIATDAGSGHIDLNKIRDGNLGAEFFSIWVEPKFKGQFAHRALALIDSVYQQAQRHPDRISMAFSADDIVR